MESEMNELELEKVEVPEEKPWWEPDEFQVTITLADGTVLNGSAAASQRTELWVWTDDSVSMQDAFMLFSDPSKTKKIRADYSKYEYEEFEGFTKMIGIQLDSLTNGVKIRMAKE